MIGIFDSGYGGLTVLKEIKRVLPEYNYIYLGDNKRVPYGGRSDEEIYKMTREAVDFLSKKGCKLIIIACNTVSVKALKKIQQEYIINRQKDIKVLGVIIPTVERVIELSGNKKVRVGIIATEQTIKSREYNKKIKEKNKNIDLFSISCPLLVPLIENNIDKKKLILN